MIDEAKKAIRERDVLARQSALLIQDYKHDGEEGRILKLLQEVGELKTMLEMERNDHQSQVADLLEKLEDKSIDPQIEVLEAKLKITEHELNVAIERAERAESELQNTLSENNGSMQTDNDVFGNGEEGVVMRRKMTNGNQIVMPPPPPPPPVPNLNLGANKTEIKIKTQASAVAEMAAMLDIKPVNDTPAKTKNDNGGIIDAIVDQIKGGRFRLKSTDVQNKSKTKKEEPAAVKEMLNILGTLRRTRGKRSSMNTGMR
ncbi:shootin-1-like [Ctenocephalides felis]|uniref:shootin-1-like n=1 Tax=Ctenocephalides felis TaxID=7515 RepID=UPI000E6E43E1|nr:shootin-1-like [Ctenocephalides felis]